MRMEEPPGSPTGLVDSNTVREGDNLAFMGFTTDGVLSFSAVKHWATVSSISAAALPSCSAVRLSEWPSRGRRIGTFHVFPLHVATYPDSSN